MDCFAVVDCFKCWLLWLESDLYMQMMQCTVTDSVLPSVCWYASGRIVYVLSYISDVLWHFSHLNDWRLCWGCVLMDGDREVSVCLMLHVQCVSFSKLPSCRTWKWSMPNFRKGVFSLAVKWTSVIPASRLGSAVGSPVGFPGCTHFWGGISSSEVNSCVDIPLFLCNVSWFWLTEAGGAGRILVARSLTCKDDIHQLYRCFWDELAFKNCSCVPVITFWVEIEHANKTWMKVKRMKSVFWLYIVRIMIFWLLFTADMH